MTPIQLEVLAAIAIHDTLTQAAQSVSISQSAASRALHSLEAELGAVLCDRTPQGLRLTALGERIVPHANALLSSMRSIRSEAAAADEGVVGKLRIGAFPTAASGPLPPVLATLAHRHRHLEVVLIEGTDSEVEGWLKSGAVDAATIVSTTPPTDHSRLIAIDHYVVIAHRQHDIANSTSIDADEFVRHPIIRSAGGCGPDTDRFIATTSSAADVRFEVADTATIIAMVAENLGIAMVPALAVKHVDHLHIAGLQPEHTRPTYLVVGNQADPCGAALLDAVASPATALNAHTETTK